MVKLKVEMQMHIDLRFDFGLTQPYKTGLHVDRNIIRLFPWELLTNSCVPIRASRYFCELVH
jgi:hypothetical protein